MNLLDLQTRALQIRKKYETLETKRYGKPWTTTQLVEGFMNDVQELLTLVKVNPDKEKFAHELSDCLWSILVLANKLDIDIENSFLKTMNELDKRIDDEISSNVVQ